MPTIAYDRPVKNLIAGLNATGHVTHTTHRKTKVTLHHNGGRLSHEGVLEVWKTRPASAHFNVDAAATVAQYVNVNEYAWATGSTLGNQQSISIEMANSAVGGAWPVSQATWREAARLSGWLFARVIGERPSIHNLVSHHYWKSTLCAGPYMDAVWSQALSVAQLAYDQFTGVKPMEDSVRNLILARDKSTNRVWLGDLMTRRLVEDWKEVEGLQFWINKRGGDPTIHDFEDLRVLGTDTTID